MRQSHRSGFTLIELLIGMVLMIIVIGGITFGITSGIRLYERAEAQAKIINGVRFSLDSFGRQVATKLNNTDYIEILNTAKGVKPEEIDLSDDEKCLYLSGDSLMLRSKTTKNVLPGSEYIKYVHFKAISMDEADDTSGDNYGLTMNLYASTDYTSGQVARYNTTTVQALYNKPVRSTDNYVSDSKSMEGDVLLFVAKEDAPNIVFKNVDIVSGDRKTGASLTKIGKVNRSDVNSMWASYDLYAEDASTGEYVDMSTTEWYISSGIDADVSSVSTSKWGDATEKATYRWLLCNTSAKTLSSSADVSLDITSSNINTNPFRVKTNDAATSWESYYGVVWVKVTPVLKRVSDGQIFTASAKWSKYVDLVKTGGSSKETLWSRWLAGLFPGEDTKSDFIRTALGNTGHNVFYRNDSEGNSYVVLSVDYDAGAATAGPMQVDLLDDVALSLDEEDKPFTTITNYSVIVDAEVNSGNGWGFLMNGASSGGSTATYTDNGYVFQCDRAIDSFPIRVFANSMGHNPSNCPYSDYYSSDYDKDEISRYVGANLYNSNLLVMKKDGTNITSSYYVGDHSGNNEYDDFYSESGNWWHPVKTYLNIGHYISGYSTWSTSPIYGPGNLKNSQFMFKTVFDTNENGGNQAYHRNDNYPWTPGTSNTIGSSESSGRRRIMLTVLEYYMNDDVEHPKFIVRMKYLKPEDSASNYDKDPWQIGDKFFLSEPAWYGDFVGDAATKNTSGHYIYKVNNYDNKDLEVDMGTTNTNDRSQARHYVTSAAYNSNKDYTYTSVYSGISMDIRTAIKYSRYNDSYLNVNGTPTQVTGDGDSSSSAGDTARANESLFSNPKRTRYISLRVWQHKTTTDAEVHLYSIKYAPGFTKKELQAIMPSGSKLYEVGNDTNTANETGQIDAYGIHGNLNSLLGATRGKGGVMSIQHHSTGCSCPLDSKFKD